MVERLSPQSKDIRSFSFLLGGRPCRRHFLKYKTDAVYCSYCTIPSPEEAGTDDRQHGAEQAEVAREARDRDRREYRGLGRIGTRPYRLNRALDGVDGIVSLPSVI